MTAYSWRKGISGDWGTAADWNGGIPNAMTAVVTIAVPGTYTVTIGSAESFSIASLALSDANATLSVAGTLTLNSGFDLAAGTISGAGRIVVAGGTIQAGAGATLSVADLIVAGQTVTLGSNLTDSGDVQLSTGSLKLGAHKLTVAGAYTQAANTILNGSGAVVFNGFGNSFAGTIDGSAAVTIGGTSSFAGLTLGGTVGVTNTGIVNAYGAVTVGDGTTAAATLSNAAGGLFVLENNSDISVGKAAGSIFRNAGTLAKVGGTGTSTIAADLADTGTILIDTGTLALIGRSDSFAGAIAGEGTLDLAGGKQALNAGTTLGVQTISLSNGDAVTVNTNVTDGQTLTVAAKTTLSVATGDTMTLTGKATFSGSLAGAGTLLLDGGNQTINAGANLSIANLTMLDGDSLTVNANTTFSGAFKQAAGTTLTIAMGTTLSLTGMATLAGTLSGAGFLRVSGGVTNLTGVFQLGSHQLTNLANGTINFEGNSSIVGTSDATLDNEGTLKKIGDAVGGSGAVAKGGQGHGGVSKVACRTMQAGMLKVEAGVLEFDAGFTNTNSTKGALSVADGAALTFASGGSSTAGGCWRIRGR